MQVISTAQPSTNYRASLEMGTHFTFHVSFTTCYILHILKRANLEMIILVMKNCNLIKILKGEPTVMQRSLRAFQKHFGKSPKKYQEVEVTLS